MVQRKIGHVPQNKQLTVHMEVITPWFSFLVCFGVRHLLCFFSPLISCRVWQPMTHLHSRMSAARKPAYSSSSPSCALITENNAHSNTVSRAIFKAPGKSKARELSLVPVGIATVAGQKSDILSALPPWCDSHSLRQNNSEWPCGKLCPVSSK